MILHLANQDKFIPPFIDFLEGNFADFPEKHVFFIEQFSASYRIEPRLNVLFAANHGRMEKLCKLLILMHKADKIILHGLWNHRVVELLALQPWLLRKCYWLVWGGDLYTCQSEARDKVWRRREFFRRFVIRRMGHLVTYIDDDAELARKWYGARGRQHRCLMYTSNVYHDQPIPRKVGATTNILMGNSSDPSNEHFAMFEMLMRFADQDIHIHAPLSYGDANHASKVSAEGKRLFGSKFTPLLTFIPFKEYLDLLGQIDIVLFNHARQQAMGNTITLLGLGKKIYMRKDVNQSRLLKDIGVRVFDVDAFDLSPIDPVVAASNRRCIMDYFSLERLKSGWSDVFES